MPELARCAYCRERPVQDEWRPFCSRRCRMADLGRWLSEGYRIPGPPVPSDEPGDAEESDARSEDSREP